MKSTLKFLLLLLLMALLSTQTVLSAKEQHLLFRGLIGMNLTLPGADLNQESWAVDFISLSLVNQSEFKNIIIPGFELGLLTWISPSWGVSLQTGLASLPLRMNNYFQLDWQWFDGDTGSRQRSGMISSYLGRFWLEGLIHKRFFIGFSSALVLNAGLGLHYFSGSIDRKIGWADTLETETHYHVDWFQVPLRAKISKTSLCGKVGVDFEHRLSRSFCLQVGAGYWFGGRVSVPWEKQGPSLLYGFEGNLMLDSTSLSNNLNQANLTFSSDYLRWHLGLLIRL